MTAQATTALSGAQGKQVAYDAIKGAVSRGDLAPAQRLVEQAAFVPLSSNCRQKVSSSVSPIADPAFGSSRSTKPSPSPRFG